MLLAELIPHVAAGEVGVAGHDEPEHEEETREGEASGAEEDIEGSALRGFLSLWWFLPHAGRRRRPCERGRSAAGEDDVERAGVARSGNTASAFSKLVGCEVVGDEAGDAELVADDQTELRGVV